MTLAARSVILQLDTCILVKGSWGIVEPKGLNLIWGSGIPREGDILSLGPSSYASRWYARWEAHPVGGVKPGPVSEKPSLSSLAKH